MAVVVMAVIVIRAIARLANGSDIKLMCDLLSCTYDLFITTIRRTSHRKLNTHL